MNDMLQYLIKSEKDFMLFFVELVPFNTQHTVKYFCDYVLSKTVIHDSVRVVICNDDDYVISNGKISVKNPETMYTSIVDGERTYGICNTCGSVYTGIVSKDKIEDHYNDHIRQVFLVKRKANPACDYYFIKDYIIVLEKQNTELVKCEVMPTIPFVYVYHRDDNQIRIFRDLEFYYASNISRKFYGKHKSGALIDVHNRCDTVLVDDTNTVFKVWMLYRDDTKAIRLITGKVRECIYEKVKLHTEAITKLLEESQSLSPVITEC